MKTPEDKVLATQLRNLLEQQYPEEFAVYFTKPQAEFRAWVNEKTGLNVCHLTNWREAVSAWVGALC